MELRQYWSIFARWFWIPVGLAVLAAALSLALAPKPQTVYTATLRAQVSVPPEPRNPEKYSYDGYYTWVASEYLVDDLGELVKTQSFLQDVVREIGDPSITTATISGQQATKRTHRMLAVTISGGNREQVEKIANAIGTVLQKNASRYIAQLSLGQATIQVVDPPVVNAVVLGARGNLDVIVRAVLGFAAGIAIIVLLNYLDTSVHRAEEIEELLGIPVLGEIPKERRSGGLPVVGKFIPKLGRSPAIW